MSCCSGYPNCGCRTFSPARNCPPGVQGEPGLDGLNAFTELSACFTMPAVGNNVTVFGQQFAWVTVGQVIYIQNAGYVEVISVTSVTEIQVQNVGAIGNTAPGTDVCPPASISPAGLATLQSGFCEAVVDCVEAATELHLDATVICAPNLEPAVDQYELLVWKNTADPGCPCEPSEGCFQHQAIGTPGTIPIVGPNKNFYFHSCGTGELMVWDATGFPTCLNIPVGGTVVNCGGTLTSAVLGQTIIPVRAHVDIFTGSNGGGTGQFDVTAALAAVGHTIDPRAQNVHVTGQLDVNGDPINANTRLNVYFGLPVDIHHQVCQTDTEVAPGTENTAPAVVLTALEAGNMVTWTVAEAPNNDGVNYDWALWVWIDYYTISACP